MSDYPVKVTYRPDDGQNRLWGIPLVGAIIRSILIIPQAVLLAVLAIVLYVIVLVNWIPILVSGRQAAWIIPSPAGSSA